MDNVDIHVNLRCLVLVLKTAGNEGICADNPINEVGTTLNHSLIDEFLERLLLAYISEVVEELIPEPRIDKVSRSVLSTTDVQVHIPPVSISLASDKFLIVVRIHIPEIVGAAAGESRHRALLYRITIICPILRSSKRRFSGLRRQVFVNLRQLERQFVEWHRSGHPIFEIHRERLAPISLAGKYGITKTVIGLAASQTVSLNIVLGSLNGILHLHSVQETGVYHHSFLCIKTLLTHVRTLYQRNNRKIESLCKRIVTAIVSRNRHYGSSTITGKYIFRHPYRHLLSCQRIGSIGTCENAAYCMSLGYSLPFRLLAGLGKIGLHLILPLSHSKLLHPLALRSKHHKSHAKDSISPGSEDGHIIFLTSVGNLEYHFSTVAATNPVTLHILQGIGPIQILKVSKEPSGIGRNPQLPLFHLFLLHREAATDRESVLHLIIGQNGAQSSTPVHGSLSLIGYSIVHKDIGSFLTVCLCPKFRGYAIITLGGELLLQFLYRTSLVLGRIVPTAEHLEEGPLGPLVIGRVAGPHLT